MCGAWHSEQVRLAIERRHAHQLELLRLDAMQRAQTIAAMLKEVFSVTKVVLYGSLAEGGFDARSDIDLMVSGFSGDYWTMLSQASTLAGQFPVSLVVEDDAAPSLIERVRQGGVEL